MSATIPVISVEQDLDSGAYELVATSYGQTMPCGPRLFRASPFPAIAFSHTSQESAERDAAILRQYLEDCASGKRKEKAVEQGRRGWWED